MTGGISIIFLLTFVLPRFSVIFAELGSSLRFRRRSSWGERWAEVLRVASSHPCFGGSGLLFRQYDCHRAGKIPVGRPEAPADGGCDQETGDGAVLPDPGDAPGERGAAPAGPEQAREVIGNRVIAAAIEAVSKGAKEGKGSPRPFRRRASSPRWPSP